MGQFEEGAYWASEQIAESLRIMEKSVKHAEARIVIKNIRKMIERAAAKTKVEQATQQSTNNEKGE